MKKILVIPNKNNLDLVLKTDVDGIILPIKDLACNYDVYYTMSDIKKILNTTSKEICVVINKIMHNKDLELLEDTLIKLKRFNIRKILFYDMAVMNICTRLNMKRDLVICQEHLNTSSSSNMFYKRRGINYAVLSNDITIDEINDISKNIRVIVNAYGYLPIFYSRRYLLSNYLEYIGRDKISDMYYIRHDDDKYPIREENEGCVIYTSKPVNLINEIDNINCDYVILNSFNIDDDVFFRVVDDYINNRKDGKDNYVGFLRKRTVYKVGDYE